MDTPKTRFLTVANTAIAGNGFIHNPTTHHSAMVSPMNIPSPTAGTCRLSRAITSTSVKWICSQALRLCCLAFGLCPLQGRAQSPYVTHTVPSSLTTQVNNLAAAATTQQQKLRAASLLWALNEATTQFAAGNPQATVSFLAGDTVTVAAPTGVAPAGTTDLEYSPFGIGDGLVGDVQTNINNNTLIGSPDSELYPLGYNLFPTIPNYPNGSNGQPVNAIAASVFPQIQNLINSGTQGGYNIVTEEAFGNTQSPYYGNSQLVPLMFNAMETQFDTYFTYTNGSANFSSAPYLVLSYLLVEGRWPDLILPSVQKRWEASVYNAMKVYYNYDCSSSSPSSSSPLQDKAFLLGNTALAYPNQDFRVCEPLFYASIILAPPLNHNNYSPNVAANFRAAVYTYFNMALSTAILFPDGAFTYVYGSNEVGDYQGSETGPLGELYQIMSPVTGNADKAARATIATMLEDARLYFPIEFPSQGFQVFGTAYPAWKAGFTSSAGYEANAVIYSITPGLSTATDPQMWRVFDETIPFVHQQDMELIAASCIDTSNDPFAGVVSAAKQADPDNYFTYDQNRQGTLCAFWALDDGGVGPNESAGFPRDCVSGRLYP